MKNIVNLADLQFQSSSHGENYGSEEDYLAPKMGAKKLGFHVENLLPGCFSCPYHFHYSEEELFFVLEGRAILRQNQQFSEVKKGDLIFFVPAPEGAHQFYNHTDKPFRFLAISTVDLLEVCEYPDSGKIASRALKKVFEADAEVDYWKGEENPQKYWPEDKIKK